MYIDFYYECVHFDLWAFHSSVRPNTSVVGIDSGTTGKIPNLILSNRWLYHVKNKNNVYISISLAWEGKILTYRRYQTALCHSNTGSSSVVLSRCKWRVLPPLAISNQTKGVKICLIKIMSRALSSFWKTCRCLAKSGS